MATVTLILPASGPPPPHRRVTIVTDDGRLTYTVPLLREVGLSDVGATWVLQPRPGRAPLTIHAGPAAAKASVTILVGSEDPTRSAEYDMAILRGLARGSRTVTVGLGQLNAWTPSGTWVINSMAVDVVRHLQGSNDITVAEVTLDLLAALTPGQLRG